MQAGPHFIIVKIDKELQRQKRERLPSGIYIPPEYVGMTRNLQFGEIVSIGIYAQRSMPDAQPGDLCIFKHTVEDDDSHLVQEDKQMFFGNGNTEFKTMFEYKALNPSYNAYGIINGNGELIPMEEYVFVSPIISIFKKKYTSLLLAEEVDSEMWFDPERIKVRLEELKVMIEQLKQSYSTVTTKTGKGVDKLDNINAQIEVHMREEAELTYEMHREKLATATVLHIHENTAKELCDTIPGDKIIVVQNILYAIEVAGQRFLLAHKSGIYINLSIGAQSAITPPFAVNHS